MRFFHKILIIITILLCCTYDANAVIVKRSPANGGTTKQSSWSFTAIPNDGYKFVYWELHSHLYPRLHKELVTWQKSQNPVTLTENEYNPNPTTGGHDTLYAYFERLTTCTLTLYSSDTTYGTVSGGGTYTQGTSVTILATPKTGYIFTQWNDGNTSASRTITVNANATYTATFAPQTYTITWQQDDGSTIDQTSVAYGETPTHENSSKPATAEYTYTFKGWQPEVVPVTADATYTATYDSTKIEYNVNVTIPDTIDIHGTVTVDGEPTYGDTITLTANPEDGYYFDSWSDGNTDNPREIVVTEDINVYPIFKKCEEVIFTFSEVITKGESFDFAGMSLSQKGTYSDTTVLANGCDSITILKLNVVKPKTYNLRVVVNDETMGTVEGAGTYTQGQQVTITATPVSSKYVFVRWYNEDEDINIYENPYKFELNRNLQIRAVFRRGKK